MLSEWKIMIVFSVTGVAIFNTFLYIAAHTTIALNIVMLQSAGPVMIVLASFLLFREPIKARQALGISLSLSGVVTLVSHGDLLALLGLGMNRGDLWMLAAVISYAIYAALLRRRPPVHGLSFLIATFVLGAVALLPFYCAESLSGRPLPLAMSSALSISYAALFASVLAYFSFNRVVALLGANTAGLAIHLVPVFGTVLAILLLGEIPRAYHGIGIALILSGIWVATRGGSSVQSPSSIDQIAARRAEQVPSS
jgi:drug/metabolite transporter (DMT)-like permease